MSRHVNGSCRSITMVILIFIITILRRITIVLYFIQWQVMGTPSVDIAIYLLGR